jgi:hypothetical protein
MTVKNADWHFGQIMGTPLGPKTTEKTKITTWGEIQL